MKSLLVVFIFATLIGCEDRYRYPCQDPENWNKPECNKPDCFASGDCTDFLIKRIENEECKSR